MKGIKEPGIDWWGEIKIKVERTGVCYCVLSGSSGLAPICDGDEVAWAQFSDQFMTKGKQ